jgi:hydroxymethylglutaryl-CoA lyase
MEKVKLTECPRDAIQGLRNYIPTHLKAEYINSLLKVGFDTIDFGSFVSPRAVPQMKDSADVLEKLDLASSSSKLLAIVPFKCGFGELNACSFEEISYLGFPLSISETFQNKNVRSTFEDSFRIVEEIQENIKDMKNKELLVYISMAFGNPYGDTWSVDIVSSTAERLNKLNIKTIALSDTVGISNPKDIKNLFDTLIPAYPEIEFGAHFHTTAQTWEGKVAAAYEGGCRRFDGALKGYGGCPLSGYDMVGNMPTENLIHFFETNNVQTGINQDALAQVWEIALKVFSHNPIYIPPVPYYNY